MTDPVRAAVVGATGYAGVELCRLLLAHPNAELTVLAAASTAGQSINEALPSLTGLVEGEIESFDAASIAQRADVAFSALPHGASAQVVAELRAHDVRVLDLSADFRLTDRAVFEEWYGVHGAPELFGSAPYGLCELHREFLRDAPLIAVPGCYPTAAVLALAPLLKSALIDPHGIVVDAKSGASGAGRKPGLGVHLPEIGEGIRAYKVGGLHRHTVEIEQELSRIANESIRVLFTPHLVPMTRGILATAYGTARDGADAARCTEAARTLYADSTSVVVLDPGRNPDTAWTRGSNRTFLSYAHDTRTGRIIAQTTIDNLVKGAAGQAVQCFNLMYGFDEATGISHPAVWP